MSWLKLINKATDYIEQHLKSEITLQNISKECNISSNYFSKAFSMITGYTLKEYIRNRRITLASYEITESKRKILDIALEYQYGSNEAFTRAFKRIHGISPSDARKNNIAVYTHFPVIKYSIPSTNLFSLRYDILNDSSFSILGKNVHVIEDDPVRTHKYLDTFSQRVKEEMMEQKLINKDSVFLRVHHNLDLKNHHYDYIVGIKHQDKVNGYDYVTITYNKAIRFIVNRTKKSLIPTIKQIIYEEWNKNEYINDEICEIEFYHENNDDTIDFYYIVSVK